MKAKLTDAQKKAIVTIYEAKTRSIAQLAMQSGVSTRTIGRVLDGAGYRAVKANRSDKPKTVSHDQIVDTCLKLGEHQWANLLNEIVTTRAAIKANRHAQTAMLNLEKKLPKND